MYDAPQMYRWRDPNWPREMPSLSVHFIEEPQVNAAETAKTGIQTYDSVLIAYVAPMGMPKSNAAHEIKRKLPDGTVILHPRNSLKYGEQLKLYEAGTDAEATGTPLRDLIGMTPATILNMKSRGIHTVEMLSDMPDGAGADVMGFWEFRDRAKKHLAMREKEAPMVKIEAMEVKHKQEVDSLMRRLNELEALVGDAPKKRGPGRPRNEEAEAA